MVKMDKSQNKLALIFGVPVLLGAGIMFFSSYCPTAKGSLTDQPFWYGMMDNICTIFFQTASKLGS